MFNIVYNTMQLSAVLPNLVGLSHLKFVKEKKFQAV
jgi:hypothetical protein